MYNKFYKMNCIRVSVVSKVPYFENCGAKLYYEEKGCGETLVFLHGAPRHASMEKAG